MKIDESLMLQSQNQQPVKQEGEQDLGRDAFLEILMTQLKNQNPLDPMKDKDFVAQMATFSELEQSTKMAESIEQMTQNQGYSDFLQMSNLIGQSVHYEQKNEEGDVVEQSDVVQSVRKGDNGLALTLENGDELSASEIIQIGQSSQESDGGTNE
ncbi:flagellar hook capping FlgD N-terminal domain-containing protein [Alkalibacillus salilacus]|uniref:Flagellar basal-body rod modification protein FlgD n=1 Tax=Alkalibacillus salilacus TaxID=284582 RepID=A0ABT9VE43_9BACI|nr:flagellar hook capping FlgD N-terminal domain-containing protein [Alkalibacillus salilacus]MDQ0159090.1 flagellar basal-body rod modification protein FlgD [Alkalibacillus salilacus]